MIHAAGIWLAKPWRDRGNPSPVVSKQATKKTAGKPVDRKEKIDGVSTSSDRTPCYGHASSLVKEQKKIQLHRLAASSDQETNREHRMEIKNEYRPSRFGA
jgi:hypothetical protein